MTEATDALTVEGFVFDPSGILYDTTLWRRWLLRVLQGMGLHTHYRSFYYLWDHDHLPEVHRGQRTFGDAFDVFLGSVGLEPPQIEEVRLACQSRRAQWEAEQRLLAGVKPTLRRLDAAGMKLAVLCNSEHPSKLLERHLDGMGLEGIFSVVVSSLDLGHVKPEPICYQTATAGLGLSPDRVVFVGNNEAELAAAVTQGLKTAAINAPHACPSAHVHLERFDQLIDQFTDHVQLADAG